MGRQGSNYYYFVYDIKDDEQCIGVFESAKQVAAFIGVDIYTIYAAMCPSRKNLLKKRYEIGKLPKNS